MNAVERPKVFAYLNFREYLDDMILYLRAHRLYSSRSFAETVGFSSPSYLKMIIDGKRNLTVKNARRLAMGLELSTEETRYFLSLVHFGQLSNTDLKQAAFEDLMQFKRFREIHVLTRAEYEFYTDWRQPVLYEMVGHVDFELEAESVCNSLGLTPKELERSLESLILLSLIKKENGKYIKTNLGIRTQHETKSVNVRNFQKTMISKSMELLDEIPAEHRDYQMLTLALSSTDFEALKKVLYSFLARTNQKFSSSKNPESIYQLNLQLFPVADLPKKK
jgi:uncharacterized protein (TIGR02147 family)